MSDHPLIGEIFCMAIPTGWNKEKKIYSEKTFLKTSSDTTLYRRYRIVRITPVQDQSMELLKSDNLSIVKSVLDIEIAHVYDIDDEPSYSFDMILDLVPLTFIEKYATWLSHEDVLNNIGPTDRCYHCKKIGSREDLKLRLCDGCCPPLGGRWFPEKGNGLQNGCHRACVCSDCSELLEDDDGYWLCPFCIKPSKDPAKVWGTSTQPRIGMLEGTVHPLDPPIADRAVRTL